MTARFDLLEEPWIPIRRAGGEPARVGLRELFHEAHRIVDLELPVPPAASGLLRVLSAMAFRIASLREERLADPDVAESGVEWLGVRDGLLDQGGFDRGAVEAYLGAYSDRFDLFGPEHPFLQDPRLVNECTTPKGEPNPSGVNKLVMGRPTGVNGAVLFGHFTDTAPVPIPAAEAAWHLIAQLYYGPAGQCTPRRITSTKPGNGDAGPLRKTVSFHPWGPNLFTTLILGIPRWQGSEDLDTEDLCPWEGDKLPDPLGRPSPLTWPGRLLTGRARHAILLVPSPDGRQVTDAYITWSTHQPPYKAFDPYVVQQQNKQGDFYPRPASQDRAVWRDVDALLLKRGADGQRPAVFSDLAMLAPKLRESLRVRAYGFDQDGQQKDFGWYAATTPPVLRYLEEQDSRMAMRIHVCHQAAEDLGRALEYAAKLAWTESGGGKTDMKNPGPWTPPATAAYWSAAEQIFWQMVAPDVEVAPHPAFLKAAEESLIHAMGLARSDIRAAKAFNHARAVLRKAVPANPQSLPDRGVSPAR